MWLHFKKIRIRREKSSPCLMQSLRQLTHPCLNLPLKNRSGNLRPEDTHTDQQVLVISRLLCTYMEGGPKQSVKYHGLQHISPGHSILRWGFVLGAVLSMVISSATVMFSVLPK